MEKIFYSNGEIFREKIVDREKDKEYLRYFSKSGKIVTEIENDFNLNYQIIFNLLNNEYLIKKNRKLYKNGKIFMGKVKYYSDIFIIEEEYNEKGKLHGVCKIKHYEEPIFSQTEWENGRLRDFRVKVKMDRTD